jgi:hypothetical protein
VVFAAVRRCVAFGLLLPAAHAADVAVLGGPWAPAVGAAQLQGGAGGDFASPAIAEVLIAVLSISNTGGAGWSLRVAGETNEALWPAGVSISVKRGGGSGEAGISDGLAYHALTPDLQTFFTGTGDYASIEIFARLDGVSVQTPPGVHSLAIRYTLEVP